MEQYNAAYCMHSVNRDLVKEMGSPFHSHILADLPTLDEVQGRYITHVIKDKGARISG